MTRCESRFSGAVINVCQRWNESTLITVFFAYVGVCHTDAYTLSGKVCTFCRPA